MKRLSILFAITAIFALPMVACGDDDGGTAEICGNGIDDDHNGFADCLDSACTNSSYCQQACNSDGICGAGETATNCMADCHCGNGICDSAAPYNETTTTCASDCATNPCDNDGTCEPAQGETVTNCAADCATNPCDNDGTCEPAQGETATNCAADCGEVTCPETYGVFETIDFATPFILDQAQMSDQAYQTAHENAFVMSAGFVGTWQTGDLDIPPAAAAGTMTYALHATGNDGPLVAVIQVSADGQQNPLDPTVQVVFGSDVIAAGAVGVGLGQNDTAQMMLFGADDCLAALGVGSITVDAATNTTATDGGTLEISGTNFEFYHPSATPYGDITADAEAAGFTVCACL